MKKRILLVLILTILILPLVALAVLAPDCQSYCTEPTAYDGPPEGQICICNPLESPDFEVIIDNVIDFIFKIAIVLAPLMFIYSAFLFVTSAGNTLKIEQAKRIIIWTLVGLAIVLLSKGFLAIIKQLLGISPS